MTNFFLILLALIGQGFLVVVGVAGIYLVARAIGVMFSAKATAVVRDE